MNLAERHRRVLAVVAAARRIADPTTPQGQRARRRLAQISALSPEGIELALREHLETDPAPREVALLVASTTLAPRVHVVLSAHLFVGALRAIALAMASSPEVLVRSSRRDPGFAEELIAAIGDPAVRDSVRVVERLTPEPGDEVHVYGRDETIRAIAAGLPSGVWVRAHGTGIGVVVVAHGPGAAKPAGGIARDTLAFDQRGCLSPRVVLVSGDLGRAERWARETLRHLDDWARRVPVGRLSEEELAARTRFRETAYLVGTVTQGEGGLAAAMSTDAAAPLPPPGRNLLFVACARPDDGISVIRRVAPHVAALGIVGSPGDPLVQAVAACVPQARVSGVGQMQRPTFDGPVDRRRPHRIPAERVVLRM